MITLYPCIGTIDPNLKKKTALFHTNFHYCVDHLIKKTLNVTGASIVATNLVVERKIHVKDRNQASVHR